MDLFVSYDPEREAGDRLAPEVVDEICLISGSDECGGGGGGADGAEMKANKGQPDGYAALDGTARLPAAQLPLSALEYKGTWNAATNTPTLSNGSGNLGDIWRVSTAGNDLGFPVAVGDVIFYDGNAWYKLGSGSGSGGDYTLPVATATVLGGVKQGTGVTIAADGTLTATVNSTTLASYQLKAEKGVNNGYASLDASGKLPSSQLPLSALEYKGTWNAATNTPPLAAGVGTQGDMWRVTVTGTQFGVKFTAGDFALFNGTSWETATSGTAGVSTVAGLTGDVAAGPLKTALALDQVDNTADAAKNVLSATKLTTPRLLNGVPFDGTADITVPISGSDPALANYQFKSEKGSPDGYAPLDAGAKVEAKYLPSYVDDVLEFPTQADLPQPGTAGVIYVDLATGNTWRWSGTTYVAVSDKVTSSGITDSSEIGRDLVTAEDSLAAKSAIKLGYVTPEDFGAVGDGSDDSAAIVKLLAYASNNAGTSIHMAAGKTYGIKSTAFNVPSYTHVWGGGTLKCLQAAPGGRGVVVAMVNGVHDIIWDGPIVDGNFFINANPFSVGRGSGFQPGVTPYCQNIYIRATAKNARIDPNEQTVGWVQGGGGKGFSIQGRTLNVRADIIADNCDFGATIEAGTTDDVDVGNVQLNLISIDARRSHLLMMGSTPAGYGSTVSGGAAHGRLPGLAVNLIAINGQTETVVDPSDDVTMRDNHYYFGVITSMGACGVKINAHCSVQAKATLLRGKLFASDVTINAYMDDLQDAWDSSNIEDSGQRFANSMDNTVTINVHATKHSNNVITLEKDGTFVRRSTIDISTWCEGGIGPILSSVGTEKFGPSVAYRFRDLKSSPVKEIVGNSATGAAPSWALAASGGRVAVQRESFPYIGWNEAPLVIGAAGTSKRWLHWDSTNASLRLATASPTSETTGEVVATRFLIAAVDGDTTPTVGLSIKASYMTLNNTVPTLITMLDNGYVGQEITLRLFGNFTTVVNSNAFRLQGGVNKKLLSGDTITMLCVAANTWVETARSSTSSRILAITSHATPAINVDFYDQVNILSQISSITSMSTNLTGFPVDGQKLLIRIKDDGTARAITWGPKFAGNLLATTAGGKTHLQHLIFDSVAGVWAGTYIDTAGYVTPVVQMAPGNVGDDGDGVTPYPVSEEPVEDAPVADEPVADPPATKTTTAKK